MLTKEDVAKYLEIDGKRKKLAREVKALDGQQKAIGEKILAHVREHGGKDRTTVFHGFVLALKFVSAVAWISWKTHFVDRVGNDEAEKIIANEPERESLSVSEAA